MKRIREHNLGLVLRWVAEHGPRSRARLAVETGLNKSTVSSLVADLIEAGLLRDSPREQRPATVGRPPQDVELDPDGPFVLGLEVNVDYVAVWASDLAGKVRHRAFHVGDNRTSSPERVLGALAGLTERALDEPFARHRAPMLATVAVPGLVDATGQLAVAPNLGWTDVPVASLLARALAGPPFPVRVENEANLGAVAELVEGAGRGLSEFVYVSGEIGVGAGVVLGGELFRGASGFAGELGHLTIDPVGPQCACGGRGCLERLVGQEALLRLAGWGSRGRSEGPEWPGQMLAEAAAAGEPRTLAALTQVGHTLGIAIASLANLLDPEAVLLGGYFAPLVPWLELPIERELQARALSGRRARCRVLPARLGGEAAVRGAVALSRRAALDEAVAVPLTAMMAR